MTAPTVLTEDTLSLDQGGRYVAEKSDGGGLLIVSSEMIEGGHWEPCEPSIYLNEHEARALRRVVDEHFPDGEARSQLARLQMVARATIDHLGATGKCDDIEEDSDDYHCGDPGCTYCELNRITSAIEYGDEGEP